MTMTTRIASIDIVRGAVMVLMAIDHVRVYSGVPAGGPTAGVFFTRWVTHFCAPAFVFLAGTSAYLYGQRLRAAEVPSPSAASGPSAYALARYLITRGLLLVLLELTVIRASWTFGLDYSQFLLAGVIWMLGWCMILLRWKRGLMSEHSANEVQVNNVYLRQLVANLCKALRFCGLARAARHP
jgi:uncharacterized membrane protein